MTPVTDSLPDDKPVLTRAQVPWVTLAWFSILLVVCYFPILSRLVAQWENDADMGHGFFVPILAGYIAWLKRDELFAKRAAPSNWGLALVVWAALQLWLATLGAELFLARTAFVLSVTGAVWYAGGAPYLRTLAFPLFLLFFMVPIPAILYNQITFPLQLLASRVAEFALLLVGVPVFREGNVLELAGQRLQVVEACSGIRSLLTLSFLSLVYGYFFEPRGWLRVALFLSTVPIAMFANASRVTITGILGAIDPELSRGFFHTASGWVIFMIALLMLAGLHQGVGRFHRYVYGPR